MKHKWKYIILFLNTTYHKDIRYIKSREFYNKNIDGFKKRHIKLLANKIKNLKFCVNMFDFDRTLEFRCDFLIPNNLFNMMNKIPMNNKVNVI